MRDKKKAVETQRGDMEECGCLKRHYLISFFFRIFGIKNALVSLNNSEAVKNNM
jgi:hypothetical protein